MDGVQTLSVQELEELKRKAEIYDKRNKKSLENLKKYNEANPKDVNERVRRYRERNREEYNARQRERRRMKKEAEQKAKSEASSPGTNATDSL
jgi:hypothetical protein